MFPLENEYKSRLPQNAHGIYNKACTNCEENLSVENESCSLILRIITRGKTSVIKASHVHDI